MNGIRYAKCEVCGKQDEITKLLICGGCFTYLCPNCRILANKIINRFTAHLRTLPFDVVVGTIMKRSEAYKKDFYRNELHGYDYANQWG
jgi:hypothetical protein